MSVYNGERHLSEAVESILNQSFTDFEFIIINDGSTDNTARILEAYKDNDKRIRLVHNERNIRLTRSLNRGLNLARSEYLARQDDDDISSPDRLALQVQYLDTHSEVGAIGTAFERIDENGNFTGQTPVPTRQEELRVSLLMMNPLCHGTLMARQALLQDIGGYDERLRFSQDYDLWWRISDRTSLAALPEVLLKRRYGNNISKIYRNEQEQCSLVVSLRAVRDCMKESHLDEDAFTRFWWTQRGRYDQIQRGDPHRLRELWELLATLPAGRQIWGPRIRARALQLIRRRRVVEGIQLLWTGTRHLGIRHSWRRVPQNSSPPVTER